MDRALRGLPTQNPFTQPPAPEPTPPASAPPGRSPEVDDFSLVDASASGPVVPPQGAGRPVVSAVALRARYGVTGERPAPLGAQRLSAMSMSELTAEAQRLQRTYGTQNAPRLLQLVGEAQRRTSDDPDAPEAFDALAPAWSMRDLWQADAERYARFEQARRGAPPRNSASRGEVPMGGKALSPEARPAGGFASTSQLLRRPEASALPDPEFAETPNLGTPSRGQRLGQDLELLTRNQAPAMPRDSRELAARLRLFERAYEGNPMAQRFVRHFATGGGQELRLDAREAAALHPNVSLRAADGSEHPQLRQLLQAMERRGLGEMPVRFTAPAVAHTFGTVGNFTVEYEGTLLRQPDGHWSFEGRMRFYDLVDFDRHEPGWSYRETACAVARLGLPGTSFEVRSEWMEVRQDSGLPRAHWEGNDGWNDPARGAPQGDAVAGLRWAAQQFRNFGL